MCQQCEDAKPLPLSEQDKIEIKAAEQRKHDAEVASGRDLTDIEVQEQEVSPQTTETVQVMTPGPGAVEADNVSLPDGSIVPNLRRI